MLALWHFLWVFSPKPWGKRTILWLLFSSSHGLFVCPQTIPARWLEYPQYAAFSWHALINWDHHAEPALAHASAHLGVTSPCPDVMVASFFSVADLAR